MALFGKEMKELYWKYLTLWVMTGAVVGCILGIMFRATGATDPTFVDILKIPGELFTRGLKLMLVPFIFSSMICSVFQLRRIVGGNQIGKTTFAFYLTTSLAASVLAVCVSLLLIVPTIRDPIGTDGLPSTVAENAAAAGAKIASFQKQCGRTGEVWCKIKGTLGYLVPQNIVDAMASSQLLGVMSFGVAVGLLVRPREDGTSAIVDLADEVQSVMLRMMSILIAFTPLAVCSLLCYVVMVFNISQVGEYIGWLLAAGFISQFLQAFAVYPLLYFTLTRKNPFPYIKNITPALATAFATASSAATFPWTLQCATEKNGIPHTIANFVLPLGVTINMDGTCMTLITSVFWLAYSQGLTLGFGSILLMVITATISSIGTAPIPSAVTINMDGTCMTLITSVFWLAYSQGLTLSLSSILLMVITSTISSIGSAPIPSASLVLTGTIADAAGVPLGQLFGVIVAVDWLRDRVRTCVNVMGDSIAVGILAIGFKHLDKVEPDPQAAVEHADPSTIYLDVEPTKKQGGSKTACSAPASRHSL
eukprot:CAMPEP_0172931820 /NCGR_PEP_ID=MMETSP1075-20121228/219688_1 /TAXON_ID=2916 /ORGANISM="Ceratium fusus, Strain PA161109" /LENGTH=535 /DNA_ID=CAMNT_0013793143 /DNA_START=1 /DNA_END=1608 /DNA_ORIENTATION=-